VREGYEHIRSAYIAESEAFLEEVLAVSPPPNQDPRWGQLSGKALWALACYRVALSPTHVHSPPPNFDLSEDSEEEELGYDDQPVVEDEAGETLYSFGWLFSEELVSLGRLQVRLGSMPIPHERASSPILDMPGAWRE
jgi:hypothetical protein